VVWINCSNQFDAAAGFGGYRESGFGREGGKEGMYEYLVPAWEKLAKKTMAEAKKLEPQELGETEGSFSSPALDRTPKLYIGGKQARPDSGYSYAIRSVKGAYLGEVGLANRKDIRNAVEAAHKAKAWTTASAHNRAQVLYYLAENLGARAAEFENRLVSVTGVSKKNAATELELSLERLFYYAAIADKYDAQVHATPGRQVTLAMKEAWGVMGISCPDEMPLLSFISLVIPAISLGNRVVVSPSQSHPLIITDLYQVLDTSDVPAGVINIVTGQQDELASVMAKHDDIAAMWYVGSESGSKAVEKASVGNLKATWVNYGTTRDWLSVEQGQGKVYLQKACQIKNIWIPYGEGIR
jgi:aldehyde dehydrogenase (NAD+)